MIYYASGMILMSLLTYVFYAVDKKKSVKRSWRIKESTLLLSSFLLGAMGGLVAMYHLRHKTKHWYFVVLNWLFFLIHVGLLYFFL